MNTYIMLTRLAPGSIKEPRKLRDLAREIEERIRKECPGVQWVSSYAVLGPCDYLDVFIAPDADTATKVSLLVRTYGHATTEVWSAVEWARFKGLVESVSA